MFENIYNDVIEAVDEPLKIRVRTVYNYLAGDDPARLSLQTY